MDVILKIVLGVLAVGVGYLAGTFLAVLCIARKDDLRDVWEEDDDW